MKPSAAIVAAPQAPQAPRASLSAEWGRLPREARDTLFQLGVIGWTVLPHLGHLPWWCGLLTALVLLWRAHLAQRNAALPGRWPVIGLLVIATLLTLWTERTLLGKEAGVTLLVVLMALKTLELRARRDALVVFFLGFFLVLTHCLYSQSLLTALWMLVSTWGLLTAQVLANMPVGRPTLKRAGAIALRSAALGLPLMVLLFALFPRIGPLWGLPQDAVGKTGLSGTMRMGGVAEIANDDSIAFRVRFDGPAPPPNELYFRGPVLSRYDGDEWRQPAPRAPRWHQGPELRTDGMPHRYEMLIEPIRLPLLPLLEATPNRDGAAPVLPDWPLALSPDMQWHTDRLVAERLRLRAQAWTRYQLGPLQHLPERLDLIQLPVGSNPRAVAWARDLRAEARFAAADPQALAQALLVHIRTQGFSYTLAPGAYGRDAVDEFWLDRKEGFCEHFAASFVVLMRAMGVPARVVTGYQGAEPPDSDGWMIVRQSHAHAWAEYWQPGIGWRRADPTSAVAPWRIDSSRPLAPRPGLMAGALSTMSPALAEQVRRAWELLDNRWNQWVMSYSRSRQFDLLKALGFNAPSWEDLTITLVGVLSTLALGGAGWAWWDRHRQDPWLRLHQALREAMRSVGVEVGPHHPPRAMAELLRGRHGSAAADAVQALETLDRLRYGPDNRRLPGPGWHREFERAVARLRRTSPAPQPG
jgi:transglutaminase-like putative cysteine protease